MGNNNGFPTFYMTFAVSKPRYTLRVDDPQKVQNGVVWQETWLDTSIPDFCIFTNSKAVLLDWGLSFYKGSFILDEAKKHSLYATIGNITTFIGFNFEKHKFGVFGDGNLLSTGYDGRYIDAEISFVGVGLIFGIQNKKLRIKFDLPLTPGFEIAIDFGQMIKDFFWLGVVNTCIRYMKMTI